MQSQGSPPPEIMGPMPPLLEHGLSDDNCTIAWSNLPISLIFSFNVLFFPYPLSSVSSDQFLFHWLVKTKKISVSFLYNSLPRLQFDYLRRHQRRNSLPRSTVAIPINIFSYSPMLSAERHLAIACYALLDWLNHHVTYTQVNKIQYEKENKRR